MAVDATIIIRHNLIIVHFLMPALPKVPLSSLCVLNIYIFVFPIQPLLSEASLTLALGLVENQLNDYSLELDLSLAIIKFLSVVASTAKQCTLPASGKDEAPPIYTPTQASSIIKLLNDTKILRHVMKVPQGIRSDPNFDQHYAVVVKCLAPTRIKRKGILTRRVTSADILDAPPLATTPPYNNTPSVPDSSIPPPKPKRRFRNRCSTLGTQSNGISDIATKVPVS